MNIREATADDFDRIWPIFETIAAAGDTYAYPTDITRDAALKLWIDLPVKTFVAEEAGQVLGAVGSWVTICRRLASSRAAKTES